MATEQEVLQSISEQELAFQKQQAEIQAAETGRQQYLQSIRRGLGTQLIGQYKSAYEQREVAKQKALQDLQTQKTEFQKEATKVRGEIQASREADARFRKAVQDLRTKYEGQIQPYMKNLSQSQYSQLKNIASQIQHQNLSTTTKVFNPYTLKYETAYVPQTDISILQDKFYAGKITQKEYESRYSKLTGQLPLIVRTSEMQPTYLAGGEKVDEPTMWASMLEGGAELDKIQQEQKKQYEIDTDYFTKAKEHFGKITSNPLIQVVPSTDTTLKYRGYLPDIAPFKDIRKVQLTKAPPKLKSELVSGLADVYRDADFELSQKVGPVLIENKKAITDFILGPSPESWAGDPDGNIEEKKAYERAKGSFAARVIRPIAADIVGSGIDFAANKPLTAGLLGAAGVIAPTLTGVGYAGYSFGTKRGRTGMAEQSKYLQETYGLSKIAANAIAYGAPAVAGAAGAGGAFARATKLKYFELFPEEPYPKTGLLKPEGINILSPKEAPEVRIIKSRGQEVINIKADMLGIGERTTPGAAIVAYRPYQKFLNDMGIPMEYTYEGVYTKSPKGFSKALKDLMNRHGLTENEARTFLRQVKQSEILDVSKGTAEIYASTGGKQLLMPIEGHIGSAPIVSTYETTFGGRPLKFKSAGGKTKITQVKMKGEQMEEIKPTLTSEKGDIGEISTYKFMTDESQLGTRAKAFDVDVEGMPGQPLKVKQKFKDVPVRQKSSKQITAVKKTGEIALPDTGEVVTDIDTWAPKIRVSEKGELPSYVLGEYMPPFAETKLKITPAEITIQPKSIKTIAEAKAVLGTIRHELGHSKEFDLGVEDTKIIIGAFKDKGFGRGFKAEATKSHFLKGLKEAGYQPRHQLGEFRARSYADQLNLKDSPYAKSYAVAFKKAIVARTIEKPVQPFIEEFKGMFGEEALKVEKFYQQDLSQQSKVGDMFRRREAQVVMEEPFKITKLERTYPKRPTIKTEARVTTITKRPEVLKVLDLDMGTYSVTTPTSKITQKLPTSWDTSGVIPKNVKKLFGDKRYESSAYKDLTPQKQILEPPTTKQRAETYQKITMARAAAQRAFVRAQQQKRQAVLAVLRRKEKLAGKVTSSSEQLARELNTRMQRDVVGATSIKPISMNKQAPSEMLIGREETRMKEELKLKPDMRIRMTEETRLIPRQQIDLRLRENLMLREDLRLRFTETPPPPIITTPTRTPPPPQKFTTRFRDSHNKKQAPKRKAPPKRIYNELDYVPDYTSRELGISRKITRKQLRKLKPEALRLRPMLEIVK